MGNNTTSQPSGLRPPARIPTPNPVQFHSSRNIWQWTTHSRKEVFATYSSSSSSVASVGSDSVGPQRWQLTRFLCPWDSPGKNTGVGCHFLLQCTKVKTESEVAQPCMTLHDSMDCSLPGSSVHGIFQARVLEYHL